MNGIGGDAFWAVRAPAAPFAIEASVPAAPAATIAFDRERRRPSPVSDLRRRSGCARPRTRRL